MQQKIAVITGASRGLGRSMMLHLAGGGVGIVGTYRSNETEADEVAREIAERGGRAVMLQLDVAKKSNLDTFAAALPAVLEREFERRDFDYLINNAGIGFIAPFKDTTEQQLDELIAVHLKAPFFLAQALLPMIADGGRIVNLSSALARYTRPGYSAYAAVKGAVEVLTRYMAQELGPRRITVNVIAPGAIETDINGGVIRDNAELNKTIASTIPLGRVGQPDDVGGAVAALLSDGCGWINGTRIEISGGQSI